MIKYKSFSFRVLLLLALIGFGVHSASAQSDYTLNLKKESLNIKPKHYYIHSVIDRRKDPGNNGKLLNSAGKSIPIMFSPNAQTGLINYVNDQVTSDTNLIPVHLIIEKLNFTDIGTIGKHVLSLDIKLSVLRFLEGKEFTLYGTSGSPSFNSQGITHGLAEQLLQSTFNSLLTGFDEYSNANSEQQTYCKKLEVQFVYNDSYTDYKKSDTIRWNSNYKLDWSDFQGKPDPSSRFSAQSNCMFSFKSAADYKNGVMQLSLFLYPCFTKKASWVVVANKQEGLLNHEQLHFDICELYIRKLRKKISTMDLRILDSGSQIKNEFDQAWNAYQRAQELYDEETKHGLIELEQKRWKENVQKDLTSLDEFATK